MSRARTCRWPTRRCQRAACPPCRRHCGSPSGRRPPPYAPCTGKGQAWDERFAVGVRRRGRQAPQVRGGRAAAVSPRIRARDPCKPQAGPGTWHAHASWSRCCPARRPAPPRPCKLTWCPAARRCPTAQSARACTRTAGGQRRLRGSSQESHEAVRARAPRLGRRAAACGWHRSSGVRRQQQGRSPAPTRPLPAHQRSCLPATPPSTRHPPTQQVVHGVHHRDLHIVLRYRQESGGTAVAVQRTTWCGAFRVTQGCRARARRARACRAAIRQHCRQQQPAAQPAAPISSAALQAAAGTFRCGSRRDTSSCTKSCSSAASSTLQWERGAVGAWWVKE